MNRQLKGWIGKPTPKSMKYGSGWVREIDEVYVDEAYQYCVMIREVDTPWGKVQHAAIRNTPSTDIPWAEKQRIKDEIFGKEATAIEVFPSETELVDEANMYHLWVLPEGFTLPFSIKVKDSIKGGSNEPKFKMFNKISC
jgi:hypothetical protein